MADIGPRPPFVDSVARVGAAASGGRIVAGLGTGWSVDEYAAAAPRPIAERGAALDEFLDMAEALWAPDPVSFKNERLPPSEVGATLRTLRQKAADWGRNPAELSCTAVVGLSPFSEVQESGRLPYTGSMDQVISDLAALASVGVAEVVVTLPFLATSVSQLCDLSAKFHARFRAAGI